MSFVIGPCFVDYIDEVQRRGLRRTLDLDYRFYCALFGYGDVDAWPHNVALEDCDSIFLGDVIDPDMRCPKCGHFAFAEITS
jgi:hypothetical protein